MNAPRIHIGRYDPRFLGVTIRARRIADVHSYRLHDRTARPEPAILGRLGDTEIVSDLSRLTVLDHEIRHFHDSLLFPFGRRATRSRVYASYNGFIVAMTLLELKGDAKALPVPLQDWLLMPQGHRAAFLESVSISGSRPLIPPLPILEPDDDVRDLIDADLGGRKDSLIPACRVTMSDYRMLEALWRSPYSEDERPDVPTVAIWEAAAVICQLAAIAALTDHNTMNRFAEWVSRQGPPVYRKGITALHRILDAMDWSPTLRNLLVVATWSQMGQFETEMWESSPVARISRLLTVAQEGMRWAEDAPFVDCIRGFDETIEADSVAGLTLGVADMNKFADRMTHDDGSGRGPLEPAMFTRLIAARRDMVREFSADPDSYVDPASYLGATERYPRPCVGVVYPVDSGAGSEWLDVTPDDWRPAISFDSTLALTAMAELSDAVFLPGQKSLQTTGRQMIRRFLGMEALRIIQ